MFNIGNSMMAGHRSARSFCMHAAFLQSFLTKEGHGRIFLPFLDRGAGPQSIGSCSARGTDHSMQSPGHAQYLGLII